ncbi:MAG: hypothetical protein IKD94_01615 [Erysipelotrichaceae bacterium]|nr:hypothetical protein [Erysipelotrichaceae bacterium]
MKNYNFGEKTTVKIKGKSYNVTQTAKYLKSKQKACELIDSGKYGLETSDFWILQNAYNDTMLYSGLIITHTGCLKINDVLPASQKFNPRCAGEPFYSDYSKGLVINYVDDEIRVSAEVSSSNCKNGYPYAMLDKRLFDRVVLLKSKISYDGIYSETESDDFGHKNDELIGERIDPETGELLIAEESLPVKKTTDKLRKEPRQIAKPVKQEKELMGVDAALDYEVLSRSGKMISLRKTLESCKTKEAQDKMMEFLKTEVKKKTEASEPCLVIYQALRRSELSFS